MATVAVLGRRRLWMKPFSDELTRAGHEVVLHGTPGDLPFHDVAVLSVDARDGTDACFRVRDCTAAPLLVVVFTPVDAVRRLEFYAAGADDCIAARVPVAPLVTTVQRLDAWRVRRAGSPPVFAELLPIEQRIAVELCNAGGQVVPASVLARRVWGRVEEMTTLPVHVARLRHELVGVAEVSAYADGYRLVLSFDGVPAPRYAHHERRVGSADPHRRR